MADNSPFHAALLRRNLFRRPMWRGEEADGGSGESRRHEVTAPPSPDFALRLRATPPHDRTATIAGQEKHVRWPVRQELLRKRSSQASPITAGPKSVGVAAAPRRLKPATWRAGAELIDVRPKASPKLPLAQPPIGLTSVPSAEAGHRGEARPSAYTPPKEQSAAPADREKLANGGGTAWRKLVSLYAPPYPRPVSFGADQVTEYGTAASERFDGPSAAELAKRYAPPATAASILPEAQSMLERREFYWNSRTAAAIAVAFVALIGGAGTLESLTTPERTAGATATEPILHTRESDEGPSASAMWSIVGRMIDIEQVPTSHLKEAGVGPAAAGREPLPISVQVPVPTTIDLRPTRDEGDGGDTGSAALDSIGLGIARPPEAARGDVARDGSVAETDAVGDGGDTSGALPPRVPRPRPDHIGPAPEGVLAYASAADQVDRAAKAVASKGKARLIAEVPKLGAARVVSSVNMRASADSKARAVKGLAAGSLVTVIECKSWCEIVAAGKRGFVLRSFLTTTGAATNPAGSDRPHEGVGSTNPS